MAHNGKPKRPENKRYQLLVTPELSLLLDELGTALDAHSRAEVIRRSLRFMHKVVYPERSHVRDPLPDPSSLSFENTDD